VVVPFDLLTLEYRGVRLFRNVRSTTSGDTAHQHAAVRTSVLAPCDQSILRNAITILLQQFECLCLERTCLSKFRPVYVSFIDHRSEYFRS
jgi:hypothetical protein